MNRRFVLVLLLVLAVSGCQPADPLAWKIHASTPREFEAWQDHRLGRLPEKIREELIRAVILLGGSAEVRATSRSATDLNRHLCQRIDGKTIRAVIVDAYYVERSSLLNRTILEADNIVQNLKTSDAVANKPEQLKKFENARARQEHSLDVIKGRLAAIDGRIRELETPAR
jgi:hypothetical protein